MPQSSEKKREYMRRYQLRWLYKRRFEWLCENGPCVHCGSMKNLEVHHINPEDKVEHWVWSWRKERRDAELAKCEVLCEQCHQKETNKSISLRPERHDAMGYKNGCRCNICREGHRIRWLEWNQRRLAKAKATK